MSNELVISRTDAAQLGGIDIHPYTPLFRVIRNGEVIGAVTVRVTGFAAEIAMAGRMGDQARRDVFDTAFTRYALRRLEAALVADADLFAEQQHITWDLSNDEAKGMVAATEDKVCHYQVREGRDLYCAAASSDDRTAVGMRGEIVKSCG